ncbi:response regulator [Nocardioides antri]|uniref:Response regulator transcription factor n=1 Tax=Nocardioides antri TaxID=2607659 RepID=A0A5B1M3Q8_9ACTN|nr:response regulator transcription factor [Nocardioides antri]KAA1426410.1 response regulator transcription factor [Nocardioides antri]
MTVRLILADDQPLVREGLRKIFEADPELSVVADVGDGRAAVEAARRLRPDVVVMDIRMPHLDGIEATRQVVAGGGGLPRVLVLTTFDLDEYVFGALRAGASGFLLKDAAPEALISAVHTIASGDALLAPAVTRLVVEKFAGTREPNRHAAARLAELSEREREVLLLMVAGRSNREIAAGLFISEATVKTHVMAVLRKVGLRDRIQAVIFGYESGLVTPGG